MYVHRIRTITVGCDLGCSHCETSRNGPYPPRPFLVHHRRRLVDLAWPVPHPDREPTESTEMERHDLVEDPALDKSMQISWGFGPSGSGSPEYRHLRWIYLHLRQLQSPNFWKWSGCRMSGSSFWWPSGGVLESTLNTITWTIWTRNDLGKCTGIPATHTFLDMRRPKPSETFLIQEWDSGGFWVVKPPLKPQLN